MTEKAKPVALPPKVEPKPVEVPDGANEAGCQPPSFVGTCFDANRCDKGE